jgi:pilus assembly protein CpaC
MFTHESRRRGPLLIAVFLGLLLLGADRSGSAQQATPSKGENGPALELATSAPLDNPLVYKVHGKNERLELIVNTSRILTLDQKIPQAQVNNPDILDLHPLSPNEVQIYAKTPGVTQVNLWGEDRKIYTVDVVVYGDAQRLTMILRSEFPTAAVKAIPLANGVLMSGYVEKPEHIDRIIQIAEEFYPKVLNNMSVSGVQQVLLHVKVMEVSRTKLRTLGFDFGHITGDGNLIMSSASGLLSPPPSGGPAMAAAGGAIAQYTGTNTFLFNIVSQNAMFFGVLDALRQDNLLKVIAEPSLVCISGRPGKFHAGGQIPVPQPGGLGTVSVSYQPYGTTVDFVPIVLGNGRIRLEVRPSISEIDSSTSVSIQGTSVPGLTDRMAETGVEMNAGQTLAIAGLLQTREDAQNQGLPWLSDLPYVGALFRKVSHTKNDVELLIMVTPELVEAVDADKVPPGGPGMDTHSPSDCDLYFKGHLETPNCSAACPVAGGQSICVNGTTIPAVAPASYNGVPQDRGMNAQRPETLPAPSPTGGTSPANSSGATLPAAGQNQASVSLPNSQAPENARFDTAANRQDRYNRSRFDNSTPVSTSVRPGNPPGLIGPVGYDLQ